jgi:hypothetical protein
LRTGSLTLAIASLGRTAAAAVVAANKAAKSRRVIMFHAPLTSDDDGKVNVHMTGTPPELTAAQ